MRPVLAGDRARRAVRCQRAHHRRERHRQGTGRAGAARRRRRAPRAPMVTINAGGVSEGVFESELFGHVKGAFTDAKQDRIGRFELADGGTLFLDEIANVPLSQQQKLLRVLETRRVRAAGLVEDAEGGCAPRSRRPTPTSTPKSRPAGSARTCCSASTRSRSGCRRCATGATTSRCSPAHFLGVHARRYRKAIAGFDPRALQALSRLSVAGQRARAGSRRRARRPDGAGRYAFTPRTWRCAARRDATAAPRRHEPRGRRGVPDPARRWRATATSRSRRARSASADRALYRRLERYGL